MSFFIPDRTRCAICRDPVARRIDAAQLPTVSPERLPELAKLSRAFAHRSCWERWSQRDTYAQAARELLLNAPAQETERWRFERDGLFLLELPSIQSFRVLDVRAPFTGEIRGEDAQMFAKAVLRGLANREALEQTVGSATWMLIPIEDECWELTLSHEGEPFERLSFSASRQVDWAEAMRELQQATE